MKMHEMRAKRAHKVEAMQAMLAKAEAESRDLSDSESQAFDTLKGEVSRLDQSIARAETVAELERRSEQAETLTDGNFDRLEQRVSVLNVLRAAVEGRGLTGAEAEYNAEITKRIGRAPQGVYIPLQSLERRVNLTTSASEIIPTEHRPQDYIGPFRERLVARRLGVRVLSGLRGDLSIPKYGSGLTVGWISENESVPESNMTFDSVGLTPHHVGGLTELSRQLLLQSSPDVEMLVRDDLANALAQAVDNAMVDGGATAKEPTGILRTSGILESTLAGPTWDQLLAMVGMLEDREIPGPLNWLVSSKVGRKLRGTVKNSASLEYLMRDGRIAEIPATATGKIPNVDATHGRALLGDFSQILLGIWSEIDLLVNPYAETAYRKGNILVRAMATVDTAVRAPEALVVADDVPIPA